MQGKKIAAGIAAAATVGGGGLAALAIAQGAAPSIDIKRRAVIYGQAIRVTGNTNLGSQPVVLQQAENGADFVDLASGRSDVGGGYAFGSVKPKTGTAYRVVVNASTGVVLTRTVGVGVRPRIPIKASASHPHKGSRLRFSGLITPALPGDRVFLQRRSSSGAYSTVLESKLVDTGGNSPYRFRIRIGRSGAYRISTERAFGLAVGASAPKSIHVRHR